MDHEFLFAFRHESFLVFVCITVYYNCEFAIVVHTNHDFPPKTEGIAPYESEKDSLIII